MNNKVEEEQSGKQKEFKDLPKIDPVIPYFKKIAGLNTEISDFGFQIGGETKPENNADVTSDHVSASAPITIGVEDTIAEFSLEYNDTNLKLTLNKLNTIQDIAASSAPTFAGLNLTGFSGFVRATAGVISASALSSGDVTSALGFTPENISNKVTSISGSSTDIQYPSAKLLYDQLALKQPVGPYLTAETDPIFSAWASANDHHANWDAAYGWGNHASAGYLTSATADTTFLKINASNDPLTGDLSTNENIYLLDNKRIYFGTGNDLSAYHDGTNSHLLNTTGELIFSSPTTFTFGTGAAGVDYILKFNGESNDGTIKFMEDEKMFDIDCLVYMKAGFYADGDCQINGPNSFLYNNTTNGVLNIRSNGTGKLTFNVNNPGNIEVGAGGGTFKSFNSVTIGNGAAGVDYTLTFYGENSVGVFTWMEDEARLDFNQNVKISSSTFPVFRVERTTTAYLDHYGCMMAKAKTSSDAGDTFGPGIYFAFEDSSGVENYLGAFGADRHGADNNGRLFFDTYKAGVRTTKLYIDEDGHIYTPIDGQKLYFGAGNDLALYHDGTNSYIYNDTGILKIQDAGSGINLCTTTSELLGFYGKTPVNQPDTVSDAATQSLVGGDTIDRAKTEADLTSCKNAINAIIDRLQELGLIA